MDTVTAQAAGIPDWTHMVNLPFALAAASFLIWSMVGLFRLMFDGWKQQSADTIQTLREQVASLRSFQDNTLVSMVTKVSVALEKDSDSTLASRQAWGEVHEDFRDLITALRVRPCLHDSDLTVPSSPKV